MGDEPESNTPQEEYLKDARELQGYCAQKREMSSQGMSRTKWNKRLHVASGVIALFSGGAVTAVFTELTSSLVVKIFAAAFAFSSGIISLVASTMFDTKETQSMFDGANQYLVLRLGLLVHEAWLIDAKQILDRLKKLRAEYAQASRAYDRLLNR